jgi:hypothetical protein
MAYGGSFSSLQRRDKASRILYNLDVGQVFLPAAGRRTILPSERRLDPEEMAQACFS